MEGARLRWRWTITTLLLGFLPLTLLIPGAAALQCHSYSGFQLFSGDNIYNDFSNATSVFATCSSGQTACVEAYLALSTKKEGMLVIFRGCADEGLEEDAKSATSLDQHLYIQSSVSYCPSDLCNTNLTDLAVFKLPRQDNAPEASGSHQCYSGFTPDTSQDVGDRVTCGKDYTDCYSGKGTAIADYFSVKFLIKTCQYRSCNVSESQSFGPIELRLEGSCCHGVFCNENTTTDFTAEFRPDDKRDIETTSPQNPLYDYEENDFPYSEWPVDSKVTVKPRTWNLGPPNPSLSFYLLVVALGFAILGMW